MEGEGARVVTAYLKGLTTARLNNNKNKGVHSKGKTLPRKQEENKIPSLKHNDRPSKL